MLSNVWAVVSWMGHEIHTPTIFSYGCQFLWSQEDCDVCIHVASITYFLYLCVCTCSKYFLFSLSFFVCVYM